MGRAVARGRAGGPRLPQAAGEDGRGLRRPPMAQQQHRIQQPSARLLLRLLGWSVREVPAVPARGRSCFECGFDCVVRVVVEQFELNVYAFRCPPELEYVLRETRESLEVCGVSSEEAPEAAGYPLGRGELDFTVPGFGMWPRVDMMA